ncbi:hypothetical protein ACFLS8_04305 [Chloroflexota bacterium]
MRRQLIKRVVRWLLVAAVILLLLSGFGITEFRVVETITFGLLAKNLAFQMHTSPYLWGVFLALLALHIYLSMTGKSRARPPDSSIDRQG